MLADEALDGRLGRVRVDVERRDDPARPVAQRCGDRTDAEGELLVGQRPAAGPHLAQCGVALGAVRPPAGGEPGARRLGEHALQLVGR